MIETIVLPTVGDEVESQYVCVTLQVMFTKGKPILLFQPILGSLIYYFII